MYLYRPQQERGLSQMTGIDSRHSFCFNRYYDPLYLGWSCLRVINDDIVKPLAGFGTHAHAHQDIVTIMLSGTLTHQDSLGNQTHMHAGQMQFMSAGTGIEHSEKNLSETEETHFLQIWISPDQTAENISATPFYQMKQIPKNINQENLIAAPQTHAQDQGIFPLKSATHIYYGTFEAGQTLCFTAPHHYRYLHIIEGVLYHETYPLQAGDGIGFFAETLDYTCQTQVTFMRFDLPIPL